MDFSYIIHLANYSEGVLYVLAALLLVELAVMVDRFWYLRRTIVRGDAIVHEVANQGRLDREQLRELADRAGDLPEGVLLRMAAAHAGQVKGEALASRLEESVITLAPNLDRRLWLLDTIITLAPLLGLFGTIIGMIQAFNVLSQHGGPAKVTGGIADALISTGAGLLIAIIAVYFVNYFNSLAQRITQQLELIKVMLINRFHTRGLSDGVSEGGATMAQTRATEYTAARV
ncbi:MAG: MotA/TolQ/ExbB proton channel family protein [Acidithiobacillus sp.]